MLLCVSFVLIIKMDNELLLSMRDSSTLSALLAMFHG
jgi:hypothetical protein